MELAGDPRGGGRGSPRFSESLPDGWRLEVRGESTKLGDSAFGTLKAFQTHCRTGRGSLVGESSPNTLTKFLKEMANYIC